MLISVNLPSLTNPLTDLFAETLQRPPYNFTPTQVHDLRDAIQDPDKRIACVFLLDGVDELRAELRFRNFFKTNNLEMYRASAKVKGQIETTNAFPKVLYAS